MKIIIQIGIIFIVCWVGEIISSILPFAFPSSIIAMILLFLLLLSKMLKVDHLKEKSNFLLSNMSFFFIPIGVSIMQDYDLIKDKIFEFIIVCVAGSIITFITTVFTLKGTIKLMNRLKEKHKSE